MRGDRLTSLHVVLEAGLVVTLCSWRTRVTKAMGTDDRAREKIIQRDLSVPLEYQIILDRLVSGYVPNPETWLDHGSDDRHTLSHQARSLYS